MHRGQILKELIRQSQYTQKKVAEGVDIDEKYFSRLLKEESLRDDVIDKVCKFLGVEKGNHFDPNAFLTSDEPYKSKYGQLFDRYLSEKERWIMEKADFVRELGDLKEEVAILRFENRKFKEKYGDAL